MQRLLISACLAMAGLVAGADLSAQTPAPAGARAAQAPAPAAAKPGAVRTIGWGDLVPPNWDPYGEFRGVDMASMRDGDPRATAMLKKLREVWDNAPVNTALAGQQVRIPGYLVPLEDSKDGLTEFLLVPYFGACVHTPPPPSNQVIQVLPKTPAKGLRSMDTVWIVGTISAVQGDSYMGASSWRIDAESVLPYVEPAAASRPAGKAEPAPAPSR